MDKFDQGFRVSISREAHMKLLSLATNGGVTKQELAANLIERALVNVEANPFVSTEERRATIARRDVEIMTRFDAGEAKANLARNYGLSSTRIAGIISKANRKREGASR